MPENASPPLMTLGERIRGLRDQRGMSVRQLAVRAETSPGTITKLEHGKRGQISFDLVMRLAEAFDVSLDYLAGYTDTMRPLPTTRRLRTPKRRPAPDDEDAPVSRHGAGHAA